MSKHDIVADLVCDLIALQSHLHEAVVQQLAAKAMEPHWDLEQLLQRFEPRLRGHVSSLKQCVERLGVGQPVVKEKLASLLGTAVGWLDRGRGDMAISRDLRDDYVFLSLIVVTYGTLRAAASTLGDEQTTDLAGEHLDDLEDVLDELTVLIPAVVEAELRPPTP